VKIGSTMVRISGSTQTNENGISEQQEERKTLIQ